MIWLAWLLGVCTAPLSGAAAEMLTIDMLYADRSIIGTSPEGYAWSTDGTTLAFLWNDHGEGFRDIWTYRTTDGALRQLTHLGDAVRGQARLGVTQAVWLADGRLAFVAEGRLRLVDPSGHLDTAQTAWQAVAQLTASPDGRSLAFVSAGSLWLWRGDQGAPGRMLVAGAPRLAVASFHWALSGDRLAFVLADDRAVRQIEIAYDAGGQAHRDVVTRPFPGDATTLFKLGTVDTAVGAQRFLKRADEQEPIWGYGFSADGTRLFLSTSDYVIKHHALDVYDVASGRRTPFYSFADPVQIRPDWQVAWAPGDQGLILLSNRDGFNQLYRLPAPGVTPQAITHGAWEIESFQLDAVHSQIYFVSDQADFAQRQLYRVPVAGGAVERLTMAPGTHAPILSPGFDHVADRFSDDRTPPELYSATLAGTPTFTRVTWSPLPAFYCQHWAEVRYVDFKSHVDGAPLVARVTLPRGYRQGTRYPMIVGSVYSDAVHNQWGGRVAHPTWGLDQYLADHGYIVVNPAIRGSFGLGKGWNALMNGSYGGLDIDDIQDGARALVARGMADPRRIGIWGSSYGGLMTTMSLFTKPGFYAAGVAGAPATNVAHAYPEQEWIAGRPDAVSYSRQSPLYHSEGLRDPLMIVHGTRDEVVLYADTIALAQRMIAEGKTFELVTLPGSGHPWDMEGLDQTRFAYKKIIAFFDRFLHPES